MFNFHLLSWISVVIAFGARLEPRVWHMLGKHPATELNLVSVLTLALAMHTAHADLELTIFPCQPPEEKNVNRHVPLYVVSEVFLSLMSRKK